MSGSGRSGRTSVRVIALLALVAGGAAALPLLGIPRAAPAPMIDESVRARALASEVPAHPSMSDEIDHFERRASARPHEPFARERLFRAHLLAFRAYGEDGHLDRAAALVAGLGDPRFSNGPRSAAALHAASSLALAEHDFPGALAAARELADLSPGWGDAATYRLFDALWAVGAQNEARDLLDGPVDTLSTDYLSRRARVLDADGLVGPARDLFVRVVENVRAYAEPAPVLAWALVELGHFELHSGSAAAAVRRYEEALGVLPGSPAALEGLASVAYGVDRDLGVARDLYREALDHGAHLDVAVTLADIEEALGNELEARRLRRRLVDAAAASPRGEAMLRRPLIFLLSDSPATRSEAVRIARKDLAARQDAGAFEALAWALHRNGEVEMAWTLEQRALGAGAAPPPMLFRAGLVAEAAGEPGHARALLEEALDGDVELAPGDVEAAREALARLH